MFTLIGWMGIGLCLISMLWIAVAAFQAGNVLWGVLSLICAPLSLVYGYQNFAKLKVPTIMMCVGLLLNVALGFSRLSAG
ncbi:MAG TPA: hypothetical protein VL096_09205 [Pirellulaceae bacterium]|nr:hypothetical protein [Pirellulaceae bacterium]